MQNGRSNIYFSVFCRSLRPCRLPSFSSYTCVTIPRYCFYPLFSQVSQQSPPSGMCTGFDAGGDSFSPSFHRFPSLKHKLLLFVLERRVISFTKFFEGCPEGQRLQNKHRYTIEETPPM